MNLENDIDPGANYMDRKRCYSIYYFTPEDCGGEEVGLGCPKRKECEAQRQKEKQKKK